MKRAYHGTTADLKEAILRDGLLAGTCFTVDDHDMLPLVREHADEDDIDAQGLAWLWGDGTAFMVNLDLLPAEAVDVFEDSGGEGSSWEAQVSQAIPPALIEDASHSYIIPKETA